MVDKPEQYPHSGHRAYLGLEPAGITDVEPVLRHFGAKKKAAREAYRQFVAAGMKLGHQEEFYLTEEGRFLGNEEFIDATIHRIGDSERPFRRRAQNGTNKDLNAEALIEAVERACAISRLEFCGPGKSSSAVRAKELSILVGCRVGASPKLLSEITGMSRSAVSRRYDAARLKVAKEREMSRLADSIWNGYWQR